MPSRCSTTDSERTRTRTQYGHRLSNVCRIKLSYSSLPTLVRQSSETIRLNSCKNMLMSLFATSDFARRVAERSWEEASFTSSLLEASSPEPPVFPRALLARSQEHDDDCSQSSRLRLDQVERRLSRVSLTGHLG